MANPTSRDPAEPFVVPALPDPPVKPKGHPGAQVREGRCVSALVSEGLSFARLYCFFHFCTAFFFNSVLILMWVALMESRLAPKVEGQVGEYSGDGEALLGAARVLDPLAFHSSSPIS